MREGPNYAGASIADLDRHAVALRKKDADHSTVLDLGNFTTKWEGVDHRIAKANDNPRRMIYKLQTSACKYS